MFKNSGITRAFKHCTNRFTTHRTSCKVADIYPRMISSQSPIDAVSRVIRPNGPISKATRFNFKPTLVSRIARRSIQTGGQSSNNDKLLLFVGIGSLGAATALLWKMEIFSVTGPSKSKTNGADSESIASVSDSEEQSIEAAGPEPSIVSTEVDEETMLIEIEGSNEESVEIESPEPVQETVAEESRVVEHDSSATLMDELKGEVDEASEKGNEGKEEAIVVVEEVREEIQEHTQMINEGVKEDIKEAIEEVKDKVQKKIEEVKEVIEEIKEEVREKVEEAHEKITELKEEVKESVKDIKEGMQDKVDEANEKLMEVKEEVKEVIEEIKEGIQDKVDEANEKLTEVTEEIKNATEEVKDKVTAEIGEVKEKTSESAKKTQAVIDTVVKDTKPEVKLPKIPAYAPYVIVGAGTASHAACRAIRKNDPNAKILVIGDEEVLPYMRPPLSKELWFNEDEDAADTLYFKQWNGKQRTVFFEDDTYYTKPQLLMTKEGGATAVLTGQRVVGVNSKENVIHLKHGEEVKYDKLLIATGGRPKNHNVFENASDELKNKFTLFRNVADYRKLDKVVNMTDSVVVIGGGFLGSELACALAGKSKKNGVEVSQIFHEEGNMGKVLPKYLSAWTTEKVKSEGVKIYSKADVTNAVIGENDNVVLELSNGESVSAGHVVVCVGIEPNTELAASAGLEIDPDHGGFRVNSELQAKSDIWIAGDVSCFYDERLGRRRVEHHDHAVVSGRLAGENMTGAKKSYMHQSMFWSDLGPDLGYEAIGIVDNTLDTVGVWAKATTKDTPQAAVEETGESVRSKSQQDAETGEITVSAPSHEANQEEGSNEEFGKGVVFYLRDNVVVGVLLWNVFNRMPVARKILKENRKQTDLTELAKLFNIHE